MNNLAKAYPITNESESVQRVRVIKIMYVQAYIVTLRGIRAHRHSRRQLASCAFQ